ncbi:MAG TPA: ferritin family protein [Candidatus Mcinerneyibacterium sp.]|nr:ferritin family protein [Candidatus Mcinerneyibacterium sp.]
MAKIDKSKIIEFAVNIEQEGNHYYKKISSKMKDNKLKDVFDDLAKQEKIHEKIYRNLLNNKSLNINPDFYPEEYYFDYASKVIFDKDKLENEFNMIETPVDAFDFGIRRELDTILYYQEIKKVLENEDVKNKIDEILNEERKHFVRLNKLKDEWLEK